MNYYQLQSPTSARSHLVLRHYYVLIAAVGALMILLGGPVSSLYRPSEGQLGNALANQDLDRYLDLRYRDVGIFMTFLYVGFAILILAATLFSGYQLQAYFKHE